jgi:outer membrane scaffolding protein for murein synthesis (MipA/OmpV family)
MRLELLPDDVRDSPIVEESEVLRGFLTLVYLL